MFVLFYFFNFLLVFVEFIEGSVITKQLAVPVIAKQLAVPVMAKVSDSEISDSEVFDFIAEQLEVPVIGRRNSRRRVCNLGRSIAMRFNELGFNDLPFRPVKYINGFIDNSDEWSIDECGYIVKDTQSPVPFPPKGNFLSQKFLGNNDEVTKYNNNLTQNCNNNGEDEEDSDDLDLDLNVSQCIDLTNSQPSTLPAGPKRAILKPVKNKRVPFNLSFPSPDPVSSHAPKKRVTFNLPLPSPDPVRCHAIPHPKKRVSFIVKSVKDNGINSATLYVPIPYPDSANNNNNCAQFNEPVPPPDSANNVNGNSIHCAHFDDNVPPPDSVNNIKKRNKDEAGLMQGEFSEPPRKKIKFVSKLMPMRIYIYIFIAVLI